MICFNTQPPEGGWVLQTSRNCLRPSVSTLSRPKAAGHRHGHFGRLLTVSTLSRPKAAGILFNTVNVIVQVSTLSRPKAAGSSVTSGRLLSKFQHSAARRRLEGLIAVAVLIFGFNTQPPEGGWPSIPLVICFVPLFQHSAARRRLVSS